MLTPQRTDNLRILFRGALRSCNLRCGYCPMSKSATAADELAADEHGLERLTDWAARPRNLALGICFTPWGEVLQREAYRRAIVQMSRLPTVVRVVAQTNLTHPVGWLSDADALTAALWCTWHPGQVNMDDFVARCGALDRMGIRYSVGIVGVKEHFDAIATMRHLLPDSVYLWVNAYKHTPDYYSARDVAWLEEIDPHFALNNQRYPCRDIPCDAGLRSLVVNERGDVRRCHFVDEHLGNLYETPLEQLLVERACPEETCGCYLGYVNLLALKLTEIYGSNLLERIPADYVSRTGS